MIRDTSLEAVLDIDGCVVGLVVNEQHRFIDPLCTSARAVFPQPLDEVLQRAGVLLDHKDRRLVQVLQGNPDPGSGLLVEVSVRIGEGHGPAGLIEAPHTHEPVLLVAQEPRAVAPNESLVDAHLGLATEVVVDAWMPAMTTISL